MSTFIEQSTDLENSSGSILFEPTKAMKNRIRQNLVQRQMSLLKAMELLNSDVIKAELFLKDDPKNQFYRRVLLRNLAALIEGTLALMKHSAIPVAEHMGVQFNETESAMLNIVRSPSGNCAKGDTRYLSFREDVKFTFKVFCKAHGILLDIDFRNVPFNKLCDFHNKRSNLMHPKGIFELEVRDGDLENARIGSNWFQDIFQMVMGECAKRLNR